MEATSRQAYIQSQRGQAASQGLPPLLVRAEKIAATVILGVHGRKRAGPGESFWQYRPYSFGDSTQRIDWRRSAIADRVYIRESEWEAANTLWVWTSASPRMSFKSASAQESKSDRAQLLALALGSLAIRGHERLGGLGSSRYAGYGSSALQSVAEWLSGRRADGLPGAQRMQRQSAALLISDFYDDLTEIAGNIKPLADAGMRGHLIQVSDPIETDFPFVGRNEFVGLDRPLKYLAPNSQSLRGEYLEKLAAHNDALKSLARQLGWSISSHRTDHNVLPTLLAAYSQLAGDTRRRFLQVQ